MVRYARFAFDDDEQQPLPEDPSGFTDEDDRMLEDFLSSPRSRPATKQGATKSSKRHLADADWTNPGKEPARRRTGRASY
jgi:hypothetical protein